ncbi:MAG: guanylate kinase [Varibaculum sp.]|nr:guanylate kinase [Varibaculum sp.]
MQLLTILSGPSGVGKGTVVKELQRRYPDVFVSVSATTRKPRPGERDGIDYLFVSETAFDQMIAAGELLEWAEVHGMARYGTPAAPILERMELGKASLLEIDMSGAFQVVKRIPEAFMVFLEPPTYEELLQRLRGRGTENAEQVAARLRTAEREMAARGRFDYTIVNDELDRTVTELAAAIGLA